MNKETSARKIIALLNLNEWETKTKDSIHDVTTGSSSFVVIVRDGCATDDAGDVKILLERHGVIFWPMNTEGRPCLYIDMTGSPEREDHHMCNVTGLTIMNVDDSMLHEAL